MSQTFRQYNKILRFGLIAVIALLLCVSCGIYSFTGASISPDVKTISIDYFPNKSRMVNPTLSRVFTEALRDKFVNQSTLSLVNTDGDLTLEGEITDYNLEPVAVTSDQRASMQRLRISVKVKFVNTKDEKQNFEQSFSRYADFDSRLQLSQVENALIETINEELTDDIFNRAVVNW